jgi:hypothetical protein
MLDSSFFYSQLALSIYQSCQLKFRRRYLDGLYWPRPLSEQVELGRDFHLVSNRYFASGQPESCDGDLGSWLEALYRFRPLTPGLVFRPEQELRLKDGPVRLVAKYDLVALEPGRVVIYDWKTDRRRLTAKACDRTLQTIVYRYLMVRAGNGYWGRPVTPADVTMIYWNPRYPEGAVTLQYDEKRFRQDEEWLREAIAEIDGKDPDNFLATTDESTCQACEYSPICRGASSPEPEEDDCDDLSLSWEDID